MKDLLGKFSLDDFARGGLVEYVLGAEPHTGAFVIAYNDQPIRRTLMTYLKLGDGPLHMFYTPYHIPPMQLPHSVARAVLFNDPTITPRGAPTCDTITYAKRDLKAGERLDGMGGFTCYGLVDRYDVCRKGDYLPMAVSLDCVLKKPVAKDEPITYADVDLPPGRIVTVCAPSKSRDFPSDHERRISPWPQMTDNLNSRAHRAIPGGCHTYAKGDDQYPSRRARLHRARQGLPRLGRRRQRVHRVRHGPASGHPWPRLRTGRRGRLRGRCGLASTSRALLRSRSSARRRSSPCSPPPSR